MSLPFCPRCNKAITENAVYCPFCGYKIKGDQSFEDILKAEIKRVKRWRLIGVLEILIGGLSACMSIIPENMILMGLLYGLGFGLIISGTAIFAYYDYRTTKLTRHLKRNTLSLAS